MRGAGGCFALVLLACATPKVIRRGEPTGSLEYAITVEHGELLAVELRVPAGASRWFRFGERTSAADTVTVDLPDERPLHADRDGDFRFPDGALTVRYSLPLDAAAGAVLSAKSYLLRPRAASPTGRATLRFTGAEVLLPWRPDADGRYRVREEELVDPGVHVFGGRRCTRSVDGAELAIGLVGPTTRAGDEKLCDWIASSANEVLTVRRHFPFRRVSVAVEPVESETPCVFGMMRWSTPPSLMLQVGRDAKPEDFRDDWVAVHEFLHTAHPSFLHQAPWLSEGLATYLTEIARMRSGRNSAAEGWDELRAGFERGEADAAGRTIEQAVAEGRGYLAYYWGGALLFLELDLRIREATRGAKSLDDVLELTAQRGMTSTVEAFGAAVDEVAGVPLWTPLTEAHLRGPPFARKGAVLDQLRGQATLIEKGDRLR